MVELRFEFFMWFFKELKIFKKEEGIYMVFMKIKKTILDFILRKC